MPTQPTALRATPVTLAPFTPERLPGLAAFLNAALAGRRHWVPITEADLVERVTGRPGFDPAGLVLALRDGEIVGGVHAVRPGPGIPPGPDGREERHIAWLAVAPEARGSRTGSRLLAAAERYLHYCPMVFAGDNVPFYGINERLWVPWYGSTERMGISAVNDRELIAWLGKRHYRALNPGDVSMRAPLHERERPDDPGLAERGLRLVSITERSPWTGEEAGGRLRTWGGNGGRPYQGLVVADGERAAGSVAWYPLPDQETAALAWIGLERPYRGLRFGSFLLDRALAEMANRGYLAAEVSLHTKRSPEAFSLFKRRGFEVSDYWVTLVKT
jgi:ribosomal protein S18 acetylase RimI-like enzyme